MDYELPIHDDGRTVTYRLVDFPFNPTTLTRTMSKLGAKRGGRGRSPMGGTSLSRA